MTDADRTPRPRPAAAALDLEARIALAEQAVIARDDRIRRNSALVAQRVKREAVRHAGGGLLIGLATLGLTWWFRRRNAPASAAAGAPAPAPPSAFDFLLREAGIALMGLLPVLWPLLPRRLRRHVSPDTASSVLSFLAPLFGRLFRRRRER